MVGSHLKSVGQVNESSGISEMLKKESSISGFYVSSFLRVQYCSKAAHVDSLSSVQETRKERARIDLVALPTVSSILVLFPSFGEADVPAR